MVVKYDCAVRVYDASPAAVGGKLPDDNFYYTEPSVLRKVMAAIRNSAK